MSLPALINDYQRETTDENLLKIAIYFRDNNVKGTTASGRLRAIVQVANPGFGKMAVDHRAKMVWDAVKIVKTYAAPTRQDRAEAKVRAMLAGMA